jgi:serine/threonine-protein kinase
MEAPGKIGRYEILEELGRGAMGVVYRAKDPAMDRVVALKTIISAALAGPQGAEFRERFYREARTAGSLAHPGIVAVFDVGEHEGMPFLVMEFVAGRTLAEAVRHGERLTLDQVCEFGAQIAAALGHAHQRGIVHRDIKPANILLTSGEAYGIERPKITDFGVAKLAEGQTTLTGQMLGTPAFMPPEQFTGSPVDGRSDLFSLGVVLYWMATGEQPFPGESITAVSYKVVQTEPVPPRKLNPAISPKLESTILKCLAKNPAERYQTGDELARDLNQARRDPGASMRAAQPLATSDPDATVVVGAPLAAAGRPAESRAAVTRGGRRRFTLAWVLAAVAVAAGALLLRNRHGAEPEWEPQSSLPVSATTPPGDTSAQPRAVVASSGPAVVASSRSAPTPVSAESAAEPAAADPAPPPVAAAAPSALDFDPKALDRRENARLEIDAKQMPPGLSFTVEMNGKVYLQKSGPEPYKEDGAMYVPPGVQEFRVTAREGDVVKASNTVSAEFRANRRHLLTVQLRLQGMPAAAGMPHGLYSNSQLVLSLKQD